MKLFLPLLAVGSAAAFTPATNKAASTTALEACISKEEVLKTPNTIEFGQYWDPLGLAAMGSDETVAWFRHGEIKNGRVAMFAFVGWWALGAGLHFGGDLATGLPFSSIPTTGLEAWEAIPGWGKAQILIFCGLVEFHDEIWYSKKDTHYLRGGVPGKNMCPGIYDPLGLHTNKSEEVKARLRDVEIKNGRLAMIGTMGLISEALIPGSVPLQPPC